jgi:hypothetical protein
MRTRPITVLATALALLATTPHAARAQDPTPTATPTASSADAKTDWPKDVQRVYDDYRRDGVIDVCVHTQKTLQDTLDTIQPAYDQDYPDFREAVSAGIARHKSGKCAGGSSSQQGAGANPTPTPGAGSGTGSSSAGSGADSGTLPQTGSGSSSPHSGTAPPTHSGASPPADAIPPQATVAPAVAATPPPAASAAAVTPQPAVIVHTGHRSLTIPIVLIAIALLGAAALALSALAARRNPRLAHAWREAAFRTRGTWADFSDWLRLGR